MKSEKFSTALGEINVSYVEEVVNYKAAHKRKQRIWKIAAACVAVAVLAIGIIPLLNRGNVESTPFVLAEKQSGGYITHHQFFPFASPNSI